MPIYEYQCRKCGEIFEKIQKMDEGGESIKCPHCEQGNPERILSCFASSKAPESSSCGPAGGSSFS